MPGRVTDLDRPEVALVGRLGCPPAKVMIAIRAAETTVGHRAVDRSGLLGRGVGEVDHDVAAGDLDR